MLPFNDEAVLTDPVCGRTVETTSPFRFVHGGALFAFCSDACKAQFVQLPSRFAVIAAALYNARRADAPVSAPMPLTAATAAAPAAQASTKPAAHAVPAAPPVPAITASTARTAGTGSLVTPAVAAATPQGDAAAPRLVDGNVVMPADPSAVAAAVADAQALRGAGGPLSWLLAWRERRLARTCAHDMLALHQRMSTSYPELKGPTLYRRVVATRIGDDLAAGAVLQHAHESFAIWPVERELNFRDVVHYVVVSEFVAQHPHARWMVADVKRVVDAVIPHHL